MNGALVKKWMKENRIKPEELAVKLGISYPTVKTIMAGKKPYNTTVKFLATLMEVSEQELLQESKITIRNKKATVSN
jgi:transcriptional regulator with XRE-family HTH domain